MAQPEQTVDTIVSGAIIVTMDATRRIITDGALAFSDDRIIAVGKRSEVESKYQSDHIIDARRFVITPGLIDAHIHITGDPLTRDYIPDDLDEGFEDTLNKWVIPRFDAHSADDERLSAQLAAVQMLRSGTTTFLEAGTVRFLDAVVDGLDETGIRARVGAWVQGRAFGPEQNQTELNDQAIGILEDEIKRFPAQGGARIAAWPVLIGHNTNSDEVWQAAKTLADNHGLGVSAHMSPFQADADWYLENLGRRPLEHLAEIGALGDNVVLTHLAYLDTHEVELLAETQTNAVLCPYAALKGAFGISTVGRYPEMADMGINLALGTDGFASDLMTKAGLTAALFKDARRDNKVFPAAEAFTMVTLNAAQALGLGNEIGALEIGKKADFVLHDTDRPEWRPLLNVLNQLVWSADGRGVHSVWVDGVRVVEDHRCTLIDEPDLFRRAQTAAEAIVERSGVPNVQAWPVV